MVAAVHRRLTRGALMLGISPPASRRPPRRFPTNSRKGHAASRVVARARFEDVMSDPRVDAAIAHWAPRFVANGVPLSDFEEVTRGISHWDEWCAAWSTRAAVHEALGKEAMAAGYTFSAAEHLTRA